MKPQIKVLAFLAVASAVLWTASYQLHFSAENVGTGVWFAAASFATFMGAVVSTVSFAICTALMLAGEWE